MRSIIKSGFSVLVIVSCLGCSGKVFLFNKTPVITRAECFPKYIADNGTEVTFEWEASHFNHLEIVTSSGDPLLILRSSQGSVTTPPNTSDLLPLQAVAWRKDQGVTVPVELAITGNATWTQPYASVRKNGGDLESIFSRVEQEQTQERTYNMIKVYDLFQEFHSFTWTIPDADFSNDVKLEKIKNASEYPLIISGCGIKERAVAPDSIFKVPDNTPLGGEWTLNPAKPERRKVGEQRGETKEGVFLTDIPRVAHLQFMIRNKGTTVVSEKKAKKSI